MSSGRSLELSDDDGLAGFGLDALHGAAGPTHFEEIDGGVFAEADGDGEFGLGEVTARGHDMPPDVFATETRVHPGADGVVVRTSAGEFQADPIIFEGLIVAEEHWIAAGLGDHDIEVAVGIDVGICGSPADDWFEKISADMSRACGDE